MNKIYIFLLIIAYYIIVTLINPFEISNSFFQKKEIEKKKNVYWYNDSSICLFFKFKSNIYIKKDYSKK